MLVIKTGLYGCAHRTNSDDTEDKGTHEVDPVHQKRQAAAEERLAYQAMVAYPGRGVACLQESHQACREEHRGQADSGAAWGWRVLDLQRRRTR